MNYRVTLLLFFVLWSVWNIHGFKSFTISENRKPLGTMRECWWAQKPELGVTEDGSTHVTVGNPSAYFVPSVPHLATWFYIVLANKSISDLPCSPLTPWHFAMKLSQKFARAERCFSLRVYVTTAPILSRFHCVRSAKGFLASLTSIA